MYKKIVFMLVLSVSSTVFSKNVYCVDLGMRDAGLFFKYETSFSMVPYPNMTRQNKRCDWGKCNQWQDVFIDQNRILNGPYPPKDCVFNENEYAGEFTVEVYCPPKNGTGSYEGHFLVDKDGNGYISHSYNGQLDPYDKEWLGQCRVK